MTPALQINTTTATEAEAKSIAHALVAQRLAACAQVSGPIESYFRWQKVVDGVTSTSTNYATTENVNDIGVDVKRSQDRV